MNRRRFGGLLVDKRLVINSYRRGFITLKECAQILGIDSMQIMNMVNDTQGSEGFKLLIDQQQPLSR